MRSMDHARSCCDSGRDGHPPFAALDKQAVLHMVVMYFQERQYGPMIDTPTVFDGIPRGFGNVSHVAVYFRHVYRCHDPCSPALSTKYAGA